MTPVEIRRAYGDAVVTIATYSAADDAVGLGSGFIVDPSGVIVTCYHVIDGAYPAVVKLMNGASFQDVWVLGYDSTKDVAVIKVSGRGLPTAALGNSDGVEVGERVVAIGNPKGLENTVSDGLLSGVREMEGYSLLQISAPISPGSSGGPVFNSSGKVVGIAAATLRDGQNLNFCVPMKYARPYTDLQPVLTLEDFSLGARLPGASPSTQRTASPRRQFLRACISFMRGFYDADQEPWRGGPSEFRFHLLLAAEKMQNFTDQMKGTVPPDADLGQVRSGYLAAAQGITEGFNMMALSISGRDTFSAEVGMARVIAAHAKLKQLGALNSLTRAYLDDGRTPSDTSTRLPVTFDSLPAAFSMAAARLALDDSAGGVLRSIAQTSSVSTFGFHIDASRAGIVVDSVTAGSPAARAGLRPADVIVSACGGTWAFRNMWDWTRFQATQPIEEQFSLTVLRSDEPTVLIGAFTRLR